MNPHFTKKSKSFRLRMHLKHHTFINFLWSTFSDYRLYSDFPEHLIDFLHPLSTQSVSIVSPFPIFLLVATPSSGNMHTICESINITLWLVIWFFFLFCHSPCKKFVHSSLHSHTKYKYTAASSIHQIADAEPIDPHKIPSAPRNYGVRTL